MMVRWLLIFSLLPSGLNGLTFSCSGSQDFNSCVKTTLQSIVVQLSASGAPELGISRLDPAKLPNMEFDVKRKGAIGINTPFSKASELAANVRLFNTTAIGFSKLKMLSVRSEVKKSTVKADIQLMVPQILMRGRFYINGRFGVWPIAGGGPYNITTGEVRGEWRLRGRQINHEGTTRLQLDECKLTPRLSYLHLEADNFLRSNPALSKMVVGFTNRFWPLLYEDSLPNLEQNLERFGLDILNKIFIKFPFHEIFPNATTTTTTTTTTQRTTTTRATTRRTTPRTTQRPTTRRTQRTSTQRTTTTRRATRRTTPRTTTTVMTTPRSTQPTTRKIIKFEVFLLG
ncbi:protein takeout [Halyomorpha halys]|uniref:protein takeout n=1 Tax=Halyomorpha halys TaxID=286706 RepID=UPI0006D4DE5C